MQTDYILIRCARLDHDLKLSPGAPDMGLPLVPPARHSIRCVRLVVHQFHDARPGSYGGAEGRGVSPGAE